MTTKVMTVQLLAAIAVFGGTIFLFPLRAEQNAIAVSEGMTMNAEPLLAKGQIGSVQSGSSGQPDWIQSGIWVLRIIPASTQTQDSQATLIARFEMVKPDGTSTHMHKIYDFASSEIAKEGNSTSVIKGTATVTTKDGPVPDVPVTIKIFNSAVIGFWIGPDKVDAHFGTNPVYGLLSNNSRTAIQDISSLEHGMTGNDGQGQGSSSGGSGQSYTIKMSAKEVDEVYRWSTDEGTNPDLKLVANADNVIQIDNPTDAKHELVFESNGMELAASGDIAPDGSGQMTFNPSTTGIFEYHCEYHPSTMKGTVEVTSP
jgi:hypothetical protein